MVALAGGVGGAAVAVVVVVVAMMMRVVVEKRAWRACRNLIDRDIVVFSVLSVSDCIMYSNLRPAEDHSTLR